MTAGLTPSQTVGPFLAIGLPWPDGPYVVDQEAPGAITISGRVLDGTGRDVAWLRRQLEDWPRTAPPRQ